MLYKARTKIHPKRAKGFFRTLKWWIMGITLGIYYLTPWIRWDRGSFAPDQAVLVDVANRRFYFFFIEIWPHEFFYVAGMLVMAGIGLFLVTSSLGRAWCGYACPQTVWVDLFLVVERAIEGDRNARIKLDKAPWTRDKFFKRTLKHIIWVLIGILTGGAWIFYFADAPTLLVDIFTGNAHYVAYATVAIMTAATYVFGGHLREQVCEYMCPWPRIQAAMLDEHSLIVTYNDWRGEPRSRHAKKLKKEGKISGDCVDCNACVAVCPMGIDIRDGQQHECITCALCIDACDGVMETLGLEKGLIAYATLNAYESNMALATGDPNFTLYGIRDQDKSKLIDPTKIRNKMGELSDKIIETTLKSIFRLRTIIYASIYALIGLALIITLAMRSTLDAKVSHDRQPQFVVLSDGSIRNGYTIRILNKQGEPRRFKVSIPELEGATIQAQNHEMLGDNAFIMEVPADKLKAEKLFVILPKELAKNGRKNFHFEVVTENGEDRTSVEAQFEVPHKGK
jgi:cytochrome c oxidase accessory protein FixG